MIDKEEFYYGAALRLLLHNPRVKAVRQTKFGYIVNEGHFIFLKYTTKVRTPWGFSFSQEDLNCLNVESKNHRSATVGLICSGDGVCAVKLSDLNYILDFAAGWVSIRRKFNERYAVKGTEKSLSGKTPLNAWPNAIFQRQ